MANSELDVSRETFETLRAFESELLHWNRAINLVSSSTIPEMWNRHILDSCSLALLKPQARNWLDLGSGGGLPGIVISIVLRDADPVVHLVESNRKKAAFLQHCAAKFSLNVTVHCKRVETLEPNQFQPEVVTARAFAPLDKLLKLSFPWLERGATGLFPKGREYIGEIQQSSASWEFDLIKHPSQTSSDGVILEIKNPCVR